MIASTQRFSDRVGNYVRYRPSYPAALIDALRARAVPSDPASAIADIGSGTGIFTALLLPLAARVYAVEPNAEMRSAAGQRLGGDARFVSIAATAETTTLPDASVDLVTAAQAFHWFDADACHREFTRILKPGGHIGLVWNERLTHGSPFLEDYEALLLRHAVDDTLKERRTEITGKRVAAFFGSASCETLEASNEQRFDLPGFIGRTLSSSNTPNPGQSGHEVFMEELHELFRKHARDERITLPYQTRLYLGKIA